VKQRVIAKVRQARSSEPHHVSDLALDSICLQYESNKKEFITLNASKPFISYGIPEGSTLKTMFPTIPAVSSKDTAVQFVMQSKQSPAYSASSAVQVL
jgi:hypothetical protein